MTAVIGVLAAVAALAGGIILGMLGAMGTLIGGVLLVAASAIFVFLPFV
jgi:hypothetical protein